MVKREITMVQSSIPIIYYSRTGQTGKFIEKLKEKIVIDTYAIHENTDLLIGKKYILITPTYRFGEVPDQVVEFLKDNGQNLIGVISSGNKNWGMNFAKAGDLISSALQVPLIHKYELAGTEADIKFIIEYLARLEEAHERFD